VCPIPVDADSIMIATKILAQKSRTASTTKPALPRMNLQIQSVIEKSIQ
jgi:hypothetical protein